MDEASTKTFDMLYQSLDINEGQKSMYRLIKGRGRMTTGLNQVKYIKDEDKILGS